MRILISNDDGIHAAGLAPLAYALEPLGEVWVVAPEQEQSARSHALTMHKPLRVKRREDRWFSVSGTPADCVYMAVHRVLPGAPDLVVSGINRGANLGSDILYSGTVAAAMEACLYGLRAMAVSLYIDPARPGAAHHWDTAAAVAARVAQAQLDAPLPAHVLLNVNVPDLPLGEVRGVRATCMGVRHYEKRVDERTDPWGRRYYWIGGRHMRFEDIADSDGPALEQGYASVSPLQPDLTHHRFLRDLRGWTLFSEPADPDADEPAPAPR